jgi:hypothetical protein
MSIPSRLAFARKVLQNFMATDGFDKILMGKVSITIHY